MARIDSQVRRSAVAALKVVLADEGTISWKAVRRIAKLHGLSPKSVYRWGRDITSGLDPAVDGRHDRKSSTALSKDVLVLLAHYPTMSGAHAAAVEQGVYACGYRQFVRDVDQLPPALRDGLAEGKDAMIARLPVMAYPLVHRNETWVLDHTQSDVRVVGARSATMLRPWVSILKDKGTGVVLNVVVSEGRTQAQDVVGLLAAAMLQETRLGGKVPIGGRPESLLCDNGAENMAHVIVNGVATMGIAMLPTTPGHSWQNGSAENIIRCYQQQCEAVLPGYVKGGKAVDGGLRFTEDQYAQENPDLLLTLEALQQRALAWAKTYNETPGSKDGRTPLERWRDDDDVEIVSVTDDEIALAMTEVHGKRAATKNGLHFRGREYQAAFTADYVGRGKVLTIRYLPTVTDWIEVFDGHRRLGRAHLKAHLPASEQAKIIQGRRSITKSVRVAEQESVRLRQDEALGGSDEIPLSALERRVPFEGKQKGRGKGSFGGGAKSEREVRLIEEKQAAAREMFGHLTNTDFGTSDTDGGAS